MPVCNWSSPPAASWVKPSGLCQTPLNSGPLGNILTSREKVFRQSEDNTSVSRGSLSGKWGRLVWESGLLWILARCLCPSRSHDSFTRCCKWGGKKGDGSFWTGFSPSYWEMLQGNFFFFSSYLTSSFFFCVSFFILVADFGVSAKNNKTLQRRDSFIGTPYWWVQNVGVGDVDKSFWCFLSSRNVIKKPFTDGYLQMGVSVLWCNTL